MGDGAEVGQRFSDKPLGGSKAHPQAVLLGLAATVSHTFVVWAVALIGMQLGSKWSAEATEPYFQVASAALILGVTLWMIWRTRRDQLAARAASAHISDLHLALVAGEAARNTNATDVSRGFVLLMSNCNSSYQLKKETGPEGPVGNGVRRGRKVPMSIWTAVADVPSASSGPA